VKNDTPNLEKSEEDSKFVEVEREDPYPELKDLRLVLNKLEISNKRNKKLHFYNPILDDLMHRPLLLSYAVTFFFSIVTLISLFS